MGATNYVRVLNLGKCNKCGHEDYDANFEQFFSKMTKPFTYECTTKIICPNCSSENTFELLKN